MAGERIFIVEDEKIVAEDLKRMLERLGYAIVGSASHGDKAIEQMTNNVPDLVLMDIRIQGPLDGVDVAEHVFAQFNVPVIYLTAYADELTVDRAKGTLPAGYILKPFEERSLKTTIELALYRHNMDQMVKNVEGCQGEILGHLDVAVLAVDVQNRVTYLNKKAEVLTGLELDRVFNKPLNELFSSEGAPSVGNLSHFFINKNGHRIAFEGNRSPMRNEEGQETGACFVLNAASSPIKK